MTQLKVNLEFDGDVKTIGTVEEVELGEVDASIAAFIRDAIDSIQYGDGCRVSEQIRVSVVLSSKDNGVTNGI